MSYPTRGIWLLLPLWGNLPEVFFLPRICLTLGHPQADLLVPLGIQINWLPCVVSELCFLLDMGVTVLSVRNKGRQSQLLAESKMGPGTSSTNNIGKACLQSYYLNP